MFDVEFEGTGPGIPTYLRLTNRPIVPRTLVVGDIHGVPEFFDLLKILEFQPGKDLLVAVGDLVDRGPASWEVVRFFRETSGVHSVLGNHERRLAGHARGTIPGAWSQIQTLAQHHGPDLEGDLLWMESLPAVVETPHAIVVHARLDPSKDIWDQAPYHTCAVGGPAVHIELDSEGIPLWYHEWERKHGREKPICIGHVGFSRVELVPGKLFALDTDAVRGGLLTGLILPEGRVVSIHCKNHFAEARRQWKSDRLGPDEFRHMPISTLYSPLDSECDVPDSKDVETGRAQFHDLVAKLEALRGEVQRTFGPTPPPGSERGQYLNGVHSKMPKGIHPSATRWLLSTPIDERMALERLGKLSLEALDSSVHRLATWLEDIHDHPSSR